MMQKKNTLFKHALHIMLLLLTITGSNLSAQVIYQHNFGTGSAFAYPYTAPPTTINSDLSASQWTNDIGAWVSHVGATGSALGLGNSSGPTASLTLSFTVAPGKQLQINAFNFWTKRTPSGAQAWTMAINGIAVGNGTTGTAGASIGLTNVANPVTGLTGTVNVIISVSGSAGIGSFIVDDFTLNGVLTTSCVAPAITGATPLTGPANTVVTINGSGFQAGTGTSSVKFNGVEAADFTVVSDTEIKARVPATATTGAIIIVTNGCTATAPAFTLLATNCTVTSTPQDLYISELYDQTPGSYGLIELYNPTNNTIVFNGNYVLERAGDVGGPANYTLILPGSIGPEMTYLVVSNTNTTSNCSVVHNASMGSGINDNDEFKLKKNNIVIDVARAPGNTGYTVIRRPNAVAPRVSYSTADWNFRSQSCTDLGNHLADPVPLIPSATITTQPLSISVCENTQATFTVAISNATGFTYQWKTLNALGNWVNVANGTNFTGATTATLTINSATAALNNSQYYCEIISGACVLVSNAAQLIVTPLPATPVLAPAVQPTCLLATGTITITNPLPGIIYSFDGINYGTATSFTAAPGTYTITAKNTAGCLSASVQIIINPAPATPATPILDTAVQPTCTLSTGTITILNPVAGLTYSIDGINYGTATTFTVASGTYSVTAKNAAGCISAPVQIVIDPAPAAPATPTLDTTVQPTCTLSTGTITISNPVAGLNYSIDGINYGTITTFTVASGTYNVTSKNAAGCISAPVQVIINPLPTAPATPTLNAAVQPTCTIATGTITILNPVAGLTYSIDGINYSTATTFTVPSGTYNVTAKNTAGCVSTPVQIVVNPAPAVPAPAIAVATQPACNETNGSLTITSPTGTGITYSIDGINFQATTTFSNLAPGNYTITVSNGQCASVSAPYSIDQPVSLAVISGTQGCTQTVSGNNYILTATSADGSFDDATVSYKWKTASGSVIGSDENTFNVSEYVLSNTIEASQFPLTFTVTVTNASGCESKAEFIVESSFCTIPKGVSPNNDTKNDSFDLTGLNVKKLNIFNRYGKEVYNAGNYKNEWYGQAGNGDKLPTGTYYYMIELNTGDTKTGWVYLNREEN